ncbi:hypothetical protein DFH08DRAFT_363767 [Mycena albidolilacea]|uniref:Uncharacterized protein n=1 Tax=Mycena albidolilacea TaxID=1033008 RepID=A0AAD7F115_9AGAR|nr:hypothetical protein DFH08DRAFT_363767 [Mycena albidolilacea]
MSSFASSMFTTADPRAGVASQGASATVAAPSQTTTAGLLAPSGHPRPSFQALVDGGEATTTADVSVATALSNQGAAGNAQQDAGPQPASAVTGGQTVSAAAATQTAAISSGLGVPQAPKVGGGADTTTPLQVLTGQATAGSTLSTGTFTITTASVQTGPDGLTTVPLTITSTGVTLVPVATGGQTAPSKSTDPDKTAAIASVVVGGVAVLLIGGFILYLFLRRGRAFYSRSRSRSPLTDAEQAISTIAPQPSATPILLALCFRRRGAAKGTEISIVQRTDSPKETCDPFDDSNANRKSWEPYIDRRPTREHRLSYNTVSTRQLYISNQVNRARQKVAELEEMSTLLHSSTLFSRGSGSRPGSGMTATAEGNEEDDSESRSVQETLERAMQQIEELNNRIRELEMHRMRLSADPPDYSE